MNPVIYDTAVIGAGAAGLMAAISAARSGAAPILLEHMDQPAKKIPATGNGKCNYTNADQHPDYYYCGEPCFLQTVSAQFSYADTIQFFEELGIRPLQKNGTCIYPENEQASSLRQALLAETKRLQIPLVCSIGIRKIQKTNIPKKAVRQTETQKSACRKMPDSLEEVFEIQAKDRIIYSRTCILAAGGKAAKKTGSDGSGYLYAKQLGHTIIEPLPALTPLLADYRKWKLPAGVRIPCTADLLIEGKPAARESGELQVTDYGISGIVIFQFSRLAARALAMDQKVRVRLDLKPNMNQMELADYLFGRFHSMYHLHKTAGTCLIGFLPEKLIPVVLERAGLAPDWTAGQCRREQTEQLARLLKGYLLDITETKNFDSAQVTSGGIALSEIHAETMESRLVPGLFFAGEIVDVDGKCGGYNLQWAWSSGFCAGRSSAKASCLKHTAFHRRKQARSHSDCKKSELPETKTVSAFRETTSNRSNHRTERKNHDPYPSDKSTCKTQPERYRTKNPESIKTDRGADIYVPNPQRIHRRKKEK